MTSTVSTACKFIDALKPSHLLQFLRLLGRVREISKCINEFKKSYQPQVYVINKYDGTIVGDTTSILSRWEQFFSNLLNVNQISSHEWSEVYTTEPDSPESSLIEVELVIEKLKRHEATGVNHIPSELIQACGGKLYEEIHKFIVLICNKDELPQE